MPDTTEPTVDAPLQAARALLNQAGLTGAGWRLEGLRRRAPRTLDLLLVSDAEGPDLCLEWTQLDPDPAAEPVQAFRKGPRYAASYRRGPGLWDVDEETTPEPVRRTAHRACEALALATEGPELTAAGHGLPFAEPDDLPDDPTLALAARLRAAVAHDLGGPRLPNPEGWRLVEVRVFQRWAPVVEVLLATDQRALGFIITPQDPDRPAFVRSHAHDLVYYSDDMAPAEHAALYARDRATIERFAAWLQLWDPPR